MKQLNSSETAVGENYLRRYPTEVNRSKEDGIHHDFGRKRWSKGEGDGIIEINQERLEVVSTVCDH